jgi:hypothetical protein
MKNTLDTGVSFQNSARSYFKAHKSVLNSINNNSIFQDNFYSIKTDIYKWFFSLPVESRIKITTVQSSWIVRMLYQMFLEYRKDNSITFQMRCDTDESKDTMFPIFSYTIGQPLNNEQDYLQTSILNYFGFMSFKLSDTINELLFLKEVRFFSINSLLDSFALSPRLVMDEKLFEYFYEHLAKGKGFTHLIEPHFSANMKHYNFNFPAWFNYNNYYSIGQYILALVEQNIIIKFVLNYKKNVPKIMYSLVDEDSLTTFFEKRKEIIKFLNGVDDVNKILNVEEIYIKIMEDKEILGLININNRQVHKGGHASLISKKFTEDEPLFIVSKQNAETNISQIRKLLKTKDPIILTDMLIYFSISHIWKHDYFIGNKLFNELFTYYTEKNAMDLIMEHDTVTKNKAKKKKIKEVKVEYDFYATYQPRIGNKKASLVSNSSPAPMTNYYKENIGVKYDIVREILMELIDKSIAKGKENLIKKASYSDFLEDLSQINLKGKFLNNVLNEFTNPEEKLEHEDTNDEQKDVKEEEKSEVKENTVNTLNSNAKKKKEKEVKIFLYDTTKGKKKNSKLLNNGTTNKPIITTSDIPEHQNAYSNSPKGRSEKALDKTKPSTPKLNRHIPTYNSLYINVNSVDKQPTNHFTRNSKDFITFVHKLHNDIVTYYNDVYLNLHSFKEIKTQAVNYVRDIIKRYIENVDLDIYGSFATDLSIESSDIDLKIKLTSDTSDNEKIITLLTNAFNNENIFSRLTPIFTASVPVIKLVIKN